MATIATLVAKLVGDIGPFVSSMQQAEGEAKNLGGRISGAMNGALGTIGDVAKVAGAAAVAGIGAATSAAIGGVVAFNSWADQLDSIGDVLGTTADESAGLAVAIKTVGGDVDGLTGQMAKFSKSALASGKSLNPVQEDLKKLGINIRETGKISTVFGTALPTKKLAELQDKLTTATARLHDMQNAYNKAKAPTEMATLNLAKQKDLVASLTSQLAKGGVTISKTIGTDGPLKGSAQILAEVATKLSAMPDGLEKTRLMTELFGKSGKDLSDTLNALANGGLANAEQKAKDLGLAIGDDGVNRSIEFGKSFETLKMALEGVAVSIGSAIMPVLLPLIEQFAQWAVQVMPQVQAAIKTVFDWIAANVGPALQGLIPIFQTVFGWLQTNVAPIIQNVIAWFQNAVTWVQTNWPQIQAAVIGGIQGAYTSIAPILQAIYNVVSTIFNAVKDFLRTHGDEIRTFIQDAWSKISEIISTISEIIRTVVTTVWQAIADFVTTNQDLIKGIITGVWESIRLFISVVLDIIRGIVNAVLSLMKGDVQGALNAILGIFRSIWDDIGTTVQQAVHTMRMLLEIAWLAIKTGVEQAWNGIRTTIENLWNGIMDFFRSLPDRLVQIGKDIIGGIVQGIRSAGDSIGNAIQSLINDAISNIKHNLGIESPSTVFAGIGQQMMAGLAAGIGQGADLPQLALDKVSASLMLQTAQGTAANGAQPGQASTDARQFVLNVYEAGRATDIQHDFALMQALMG